MSEVRSVKVGQVWADNDKRLTVPRYVRVDAVWYETGARPWTAKVIRCDADGQSWSPLRVTWIALRRFVPNATGYRLVKDASAPPG